LDKTRYSNSELIDCHAKAPSSNAKALYRHRDKEEFYKNPLEKQGNSFIMFMEIEIRAQH